jgi:hypothetical protein
MARLLVALVIAVIALTASAPATQVPEGTRQPPLYFPVQKGARWVYEDTELWFKESGPHGEYSEVVTDVSDGARGAKVVTVARVEAGGKTGVTRSYEVSTTGVFGLPERGALSTRPFCYLKLPHKAGQTWDSFVAHGPEKLKVPAGEFEVIRVEWRYYDGPLDVTYYAPGVGPVKKVWQQSQISVLKSFTPGKN